MNDDGMNIFIAFKYLEICDNIHVTTAKYGENALCEFARANYDIILTDANMPIRNGCLLRLFARENLYKVVYEEILRHKTAPFS